MAVGPDSSCLCFPGGKRCFATPQPALGLHVHRLQLDTWHALAVTPCRTGTRCEQGTVAAWDPIPSVSS